MAVQNIGVVTDIIGNPKRGVIQHTYYTTDMLFTLRIATPRCLILNVPTVAPSAAYRNNGFLASCRSPVPKSETGNGSLHLRYKEFGSVGQWMRNRALMRFC